MKLGTKLAVGSVLMIGALALTSGQADALVIDDFNNSGFIIDTSGGDPPFSSIDQTGVAGVVGGDRDASVALDSGTGNITGNMDNIGGLGVTGSYTLEAPVTGAGRWTLVYGDDGDLMVDITDGGTMDSFGLDFVLADNTATVTIAVMTGAGAGSKTVAVPGAGVLSIPFAMLSGTPDLTDVDKITVTIVGGTAGDYQLDLIGTTNVIPLPAASWMGLTVLGGLVIRKMRRRNA